MNHLQRSGLFTSTIGSAIAILCVSVYALAYTPQDEMGRIGAGAMTLSGLLMVLRGALLYRLGSRQKLRA
jgi:hypothetical protein